MSAVYSLSKLNSVWTRLRCSLFQGSRRPCTTSSSTWTAVCVSLGDQPSLAANTAVTYISGGSCSTTIRRPRPPSPSRHQRLDPCDPLAGLPPIQVTGTRLQHGERLWFILRLEQGESLHPSCSQRGVRVSLGVLWSTQKILRGVVEKVRKPTAQASH